MTSTEEKKGGWLVLLYVAADDLPSNKPRAGTISVECNGMMERLTKTSLDPNVTVVALTDDSVRQKKSDEVSYLSPAISILKRNPPSDVQGQTINSWHRARLDEETELLFDYVDGLRELDTGTTRTLAYFLRWALKEYPGRQVMLSTIGHGGGWSDLTPFERASSQSDNGGTGQVAGGGSFQKKGGGYTPSLNGLCPDSTSNTALSLPDLRRALEFGLNGQKLDVLFLDACLMGMIEVAYEIRAHAQYLIAGESLLWAQLPYDLYLGNDNLKPDTKPHELARSIVEKYNSRPRRVQKSWSLAAISLDKIDKLRAEVEELASKLSALLDTDQKTAIRSIALAYNDSQQFDDNADFNVNHKESYVDILDFSLRLKERIGTRAQSLALADPGGVATTASAIEDVIDLRSRVRRKAKDDKIESEQGAINIGTGFDPSKVIFSSLAQTDEETDLDNAYGLSIYFPLGDIVDAAEKLPANEEAAEDEMLPAVEILDLHLARYKSQLRFTRDTPSWVGLLDKLKSVLTNTEDLYREEEEPTPVDRIVSTGKIASRSFEPRSKSVRIFKQPRQRS